ncbi:acetyl-CoA carboxylase biotin carboxyl carrier protein [Flindersiella endophytica]
MSDAPRSLRLRAGELAVEMEFQPVPDATEPAAPLPTGSLDPGPADEDAGLRYITAPLVGTFYRAPEPNAAPFVTEGDQVQPGQQVAIVEAMKTMLPVESELAGEVVKILVPDGGSVEYGEHLIAVAPTEPEPGQE